MMRTRFLGTLMIACGAALGLVPALSAQSLRGSSASVERMYVRAQENDLTFHRTATALRGAVGEGSLVRLTGNEDFLLQRVSYPFVIPATRAWVEAFAPQYHEHCKTPLVITSGARPQNGQPRNSSPISVHPTGMAVDLRKPRGACLRWLRNELLSAERDGVLEATEERRPAHFHVAVFPDRVAQPTRVAEVRGPAKPEYERYRVRKGDTLWDIARRVSTPVKELREINNLRSSRILPGQTLLVPADEY
jgi:LysM repeat protein